MAVSLDQILDSTRRTLPSLRERRGVLERDEELPPFEELAAEFGEAKVFRPNRDTRFSKDKTPYKTTAGIWFKHEQAKDVHAPGFYLHLAPGDVFAAGHAESGNETSIVMSITKAEKVPGGYKFTGRKSFGSLTPVWTRLGIHGLDMGLIGRRIAPIAALGT